MPALGNRSYHSNRAAFESTILTPSGERDWILWIWCHELNAWRDQRYSSHWDAILAQKEHRDMIKRGEIKGNINW